MEYLRITLGSIDRFVDMFGLEQSADYILKAETWTGCFKVTAQSLRRTEHAPSSAEHAVLDITGTIECIAILYRNFTVPPQITFPDGTKKHVIICEDKGRLIDEICIPACESIARLYHEGMRDNITHIP